MEKCKDIIMKLPKNIIILILRFQYFIVLLQMLNDRHFFNKEVIIHNIYFGLRFGVVNSINT